ncbi:non-ribosomal peptide synthetase [Anaerosporobacter faecicola]|uniref:non-ribosomal peptide synthetase n=1 Tax=Anaerosporobacter faecicola TaxID=2718714 RepID=UPI001438B850|nr:non-ribosomal peptide synthetase [Anaerosporobacter faecicola]
MNKNKLVQLIEMEKINNKLWKDNITWKIYCLSSFVLMLNKMHGLEEYKILIQEEKQRVLQVKLEDDITFNELCCRVKEYLERKCEEDICDLKQSDVQAIFLMEAQQSQLEELLSKFSHCLCMVCSQDQTSVSCRFEKVNACECYIDLLEQRFNEISRHYLLPNDIKLRDISIIGDEEKKKIQDFSRENKSEIPDKTFHELFEEQVLKSPNKTAVICGEETITYDELNKRANQLANYINENIEGTENLIGIYMERSIEFIVSIFGIIKSGNAYVPIDQDTLNPGHSGSFPKSRLRFMLNDTKMKLVITKKKYEQDIPSDGREVLCLENENLKKYSSDNIDKRLTIYNLIYGIYTSGSTGYPKLTLVEHKSVLNLFNNINNFAYSKLTENKTHIVAQNAPFGFDASVQQLGCFVKGYTLCILTERIRKSAKAIIDCILENKISVFDCTPSQLELLINEGILIKCSDVLEVVLVGGESIPSNMWTQLVKEKRINIFNVYGPAECTVDSTYYLINGSEHEYPVIGKAIDNCCIHILDEEQNIVPIGTVGEIYISGYGVSRGYYNREELNKSSFFENLTSCNEKVRLYKTGDKAYYLADGNIRYVGRSDDQVKIRSHRIELAEITTNLCKNDNIKDALVTVNDSSGYKKLIAYVILKDDSKFDAQNISDFLADYVPKYMVPNQYIPLSEWPLTANMKIDKKRLPLPEEIHEEGANGIDSKDAIERELAEIMVRILKIKMITDTDNFMTLGGDSLRVMTLLAEIFSKYNTEIDFEEFFKNPTLKFIKQKVVDTRNKENV